MSVSVATAKAHCRVSTSTEDTIITAYLAAATAWIQRFIKQNLVSAAVTDYFTEFGDYLELSTGPNSTIDLTSITYDDANGDSQTLDLDTVSLRDGRVYPPAAGWPAIYSNSTIVVVYAAGYATTPAELEQAQLLLVDHFYEYRGLSDPLEGTPEANALDALCRPFRKPTVR